MDDLSEMFWFPDVVSSRLNQLPTSERNTLHEKFDVQLKQRHITHVYCTCFSEDSDSRSQWLEYADNGHGFAVGFDPTTFELKRSKGTRDVELSPVIYNQKEQVRMANEVITRLREIDDENADKIHQFFANYDMWWRAARCKNPAFENEKEWRLIFRDTPENIAFREKDGRHLIPFTTFSFDPGKNPIREIVLGPRNQSQRNVDAVSQLLGHYGYDETQISFIGSKIPLRPEYS
jgi:hypothetical protein